MAITFCIALGLVIGAAAYPADGDAWIYPYRRQLNWHYGLLAAGSVGIVIRAVKDAWAIFSKTLLATSTNVRLSRRWSILWRMLVAAIITTCLTLRIATARQFWTPPTSDTYFYDDVLTGYVWWLGLLIVLGSELRSSRHPRPRKHRPLIGFLTVCSAVVLLAYIVIDLIIISFWVHLTCAGIDRSLVHHDGRYALRNVADETRFAGLATAALFALIGAVALFVYAAKKPSPPAALTRSAAIVALLLLGGAASYVVWFHRIGMPAASPDLAGAGVCSNWFLQIGGIILASMAVTVAAHRMATANEDMQSAALIIRRNQCVTFAIAPIFISSAAVIYLAEANDVVKSFGNHSFLETLYYSLLQPSTYFMLALLAYSVRRVWMRWKRAAPSDLRVFEIDPRRFARCWLALAALTVIAVPTIAAFGFAFWLSPWYRW